MTLALSLATPSAARACSGSERGRVSSRRVFPADGATNVPTNVRVVVSYIASGTPVTDELRLATVASPGNPLSASVSQPLKQGFSSTTYHTYVLAPQGSLAPNTTYRVTSLISTVPCVQYPYSQASSLTAECTRDQGDAMNELPAVRYTIAEFTTGSGPDNQAPVLSGPISLSNTHYSCTAGACCGPYDGFAVAFSWGDATDDGPVLYQILRDGAPVIFPTQDTTGQVTPGRVQGAFLCSGTLTQLFAMGGYTQFIGTPGPYQVVAVDLAGNRSSPVTVDVAVDCAMDGGVPDPDGGAIPDAPLLPEVSHPADVPPPDAPEAGQPRPVDAHPTIDLLAAVDLAAPGVDSGAPMPDVAPADARPDLAIASPDLALRFDAPAPRPDAATPHGDAAVVAPPKSDDSGCSCRLGHRRGGAAALALIAFALPWGMVRRRRR